MIELGEHNERMIYCIVSAEDFEWAMQWRWRYQLDKRGKKYYAVRHSRVYDDAGGCKQVNIYLHKAILQRMGKRRRTAAHCIGEHGDGDSLNCCRTNLSWITRSRNCKTAKVKTPRCPRGRFITPELTTYKACPYREVDAVLLAT